MRMRGELDLLAEHGARVCLCPTTEASLGDGYAPVAALCERGIGICIGSDSNVRIDPLEELRELEGIARRDAGRRNVVSLGSLLSFGSDEGAAALGLDAWPETSADLGHPSLAGVDAGDVLGALVLGCSADVFALGAASGARRHCRATGGTAATRTSCGRGRRARTPCRSARRRRRSPGRSTWRPCRGRGRAGSICVPSCHSL